MSLPSTRPEDLEVLLDAVADHARRRLVKLDGRTARRRREILAAAEEHVRALEVAAEDLGDVRGRAVEASVEASAEAEVREVVEGAFDRLCERFLRRVRSALDALPEEPGYADALRAWASEAASRMSGPCEVFAAPKDADPVYEALLAADAVDFRVLTDRRVRCGFVVRDLDGRTVLDRRPEALLEERAEALREILQGATPPAPTLEAPPASSGEDGPAPSR